MDRVGFEPTTSASSLKMSWSIQQQLKRHPNFTCSISMLHKPYFERSFEKKGDFPINGQIIMSVSYLFNRKQMGNLHQKQLCDMPHATSQQIHFSLLLMRYCVNLVQTKSNWFFNSFPLCILLRYPNSLCHESQHTAKQLL